MTTSDKDGRRRDAAGAWTWYSVERGETPLTADRVTVAQHIGRRLRWLYAGAAPAEASEAMRRLLARLDAKDK